MRVLLVLLRPPDPVSGTARGAVVKKFFLLDLLCIFTICEFSLFTAKEREREGDGGKHENIISLSPALIKLSDILEFAFPETESVEFPEGKRYLWNSDSVE